jgi:hypothetical protein
MKLTNFKIQPSQGIVDYVLIFGEVSAEDEHLATKCGKKILNLRKYVPGDCSKKLEAWKRKKQAEAAQEYEKMQGVREDHLRHRTRVESGEY